MGLLNKTNKRKVTSLNDAFMMGTMDLCANSDTPIKHWREMIPSYYKHVQRNFVWGLAIPSIDEFIKKEGFAMFVDKQTAARFIVEVLKYPGTKRGKRIEVAMTTCTSWNKSRTFRKLRWGPRCSCAQVSMDINPDWFGEFDDCLFNLIVYKDGTFKLEQ